MNTPVKRAKSTAIQRWVKSVTRDAVLLNIKMDLLSIEKDRKGIIGYLKELYKYDFIIYIIWHLTLKRRFEHRKDDIQYGCSTMIFFLIQRKSQSLLESYRIIGTLSALITVKVSTIPISRLTRSQILDR